ncbi:MAG: hypothetical protein IV100_29020 [Myxococcales bacterium]|nr:hypothetical protein [Myxococcales bacterium]
MSSARLATLFTSTILASSVASAGPYDGFRLGFLGSFGFGGETEAKATGGLKADSDNEATAGFVITGQYPIWTYITVGLEFGVLFTKTEAMDRLDQDRNALIDIAPVIEGKYPLLGGRLEPFLKMPFGLSIYVPSDDLKDVSTGVGWTVGLMAGARYFVWSGLAVEAELGWQGHGGSYDYEAQGFEKVEYDYEGHQFQLRFGVLWSF